jgi:capsular exopolysaccharide synthesis family protein
LLRTAQFEATASIRVRPIMERIVFSTEENGVVPLYASFVNTQVSVIRSSLVLSRVLAREDIKRTSFLAGQAGAAVVDHDRLLENMLLALKVGPRRGTELIDVTAVCGSAEEAKLLADAVVDEYRRYMDEQIRADDVARAQTLDDELLETESMIDGTITSIHDVSEGLGVEGSTDLNSQAAGHLRLLETARDQLSRELELTRWELQSLRAAGVQSPEDTQAETHARSYALDAEWRRLQMQLRQRESEVQQASSQYGRYHPRMRQMAATVDQARTLLAEREAQLDQQVPGSAPAADGVAPTGEVVDRSTLGHLERRQAYEIELLNGDIERYRKELQDSQKKAHTIAEMQEDLRRYRSHAQTLEQRRQVLDVESKAPARVSVAYYAMKPSTPRQDRRVLMSLMAVVGALAAGLGVAYLRGTLDQRIHAASDVNSTAAAAFLGQVPELPGDCDPVSADHQQLGEHMRMVRTALLRRLAGTGRQVVLITSSISRNGKTSVAILLARSLAQLGKRVLLVEGDLRRPEMAVRLLETAPQVGLAALLEGRTSDDEAILQGVAPRLDVLPAGPLPLGFDFEKLANGLFSGCLKRWKQRYDLIIMDSPPVLPVADARILAGQVDGTVMVLRAAHCARGDVLKAYADLSAAGGTLLGTVLVGGRPRDGYGYGYGYGTEGGAEVKVLEATVEEKADGKE